MVRLVTHGGAEGGVDGESEEGPVRHLVSHATQVLEIKTNERLVHHFYRYYCISPTIFVKNRFEQSFKVGRSQEFRRVQRRSLSFLQKMLFWVRKGSFNKLTSQVRSVFMFHSLQLSRLRSHSRPDKYFSCWYVVAMDSVFVH